jgi:hypothetical protein
MDHNKIIAASQSFKLEGPGTTVSNPVSQVENILSTVIGFLSIVAVIFFVIQVILAGYGFISGQGDEKKVATARKKLTDSILGLTIVVVAYGVGGFISKILGLSNIFDLSAAVNLLKFQ